MAEKKQINFPRYEQYKDSGIEWIGEIPEHWDIIKLKYLMSINMGQSPKSEDCNLDNKGLPFLQGNAEFGTKYPKHKLSCINTPKIANKNEILLSVRAPVGALNISDQVYGIGRGLCSLGANEPILSFVWWYLHGNKSRLDALSTGSTFQAISSDTVRQLNITIPPSDEQTAIAQFLDHKTAQIDRAIAIKEAQIKLLNERKQIMIQEAVTKGLDPSVPMKDSGIEWIGEIPAHWEVSKAKFYSSVFVPERSKPELNTNRNGVPWITTDQLRKNTLLIQDAKYFVSEKEANRVGSRKVKKNSVLATCVGTFGLASINNFECIINQQIQAYTNLKINELFFQKIIELSKDYFEINATMTTIAYVNSQAFENMPIVIPPLKEQLKIVHFINKQENHITTGIDNYQSQIQTLKEYKTTLINEAVTGKIKVY